MSMKKSEGFSAEERAAMKERARELKAQAQGTDGEADALAKVAEMPEDEQELATGFHELVKEVAPDLTMKTWYGMPAYATPGKKGKVVCYFQSGAKMQTRYCTIGFNDAAHLDHGSLWATSFAITAWNATNARALRVRISESCLRNWMAQADIDAAGGETQLTSKEKKELAELRRDKRRLEMEWRSSSGRPRKSSCSTRNPG